MALLDDLERRYDTWLRDGLGPLVPELEARDALRGRPVAAGGVTGVAAGIAPDGRLRVVADGGTEVLVASGEVELTRARLRPSRRAPARAGSRSGP